MPDISKYPHKPQRIFLYGFTFVFLLLSSISIVVLTIVHSNSQKIQDAVHQQETISRNIHALRSIARQRGLILLSIINNPDPFERDELTQKYNALARDFLKIREQLNSFDYTVKQRIAFDRALELVNQLAISQRKSLHFAEENNLEASKKVANEEILPNKEIIQDAYDKFDESITMEIDALLNKARKTTQTAHTTSIIVILISLGIASWIAFYVYNYIKNSREAMNRLNMQLEDSNAVKSEFLSRLGHELFTPMNVIMGFTQILLANRKELNEKQVQALDDIYSSSKRLHALINEILDIQRLDKNSFLPSIETLYPLTLIDEILTILGPQIEAKKLSVIKENCDPTITVDTDRNNLKQILLNIISNAIKFNKDRGSITISCIRTSDKSKIIIADTGKGIPEQKISKIFEPFERLDVFENITGSGIGLTVTKKLADLLNIDIQVTSELHKRTVFTLTFSHQ